MNKVLVLASLLAVAATAHAQTTIKISGYGGTDPAVVGDLINRFVKPAVAKDNINVVYEPLQGDYNAALTNLLSAGTAGDVFYLPAETAPGFIATGKVLPLNGLVDTKPFIGSLNRVFTQGGKQYAIPKDFNTLAIVYNKDIFDEAKVPYPTNDDTWTTFGNKLRQVRKALGDDYYGVCFPPDYARMGAFAFASGWRPFDSSNKTNFNSALFKPAFDWYTGLAKDKTAIQPSDLSQGWSGGCFATGKVATAIEGNWIVGFLRDQAPNLRYGTVLLPKYDKTNARGNFLYTVGWAINKDSRNRDAAVKVLNALTSPQAQQYILEQGLAIPSRSALANNAFFRKSGPEAENARTVFQGATSGNVRGFTFGGYPAGDFMRPINEALTGVLSGKTTSAEALRKAQTDIEALQRR